MPGRRAGSGVGKYILYSVQCREPKTGQQKVQLSSKTKHFSHLGMINLLSTRTLLIPPTPYTKDFVQGVCAIHTYVCLYICNVHICLVKPVSDKSNNSSLHTENTCTASRDL